MQLFDTRNKCILLLFANQSYLKQNLIFKILWLNLPRGPACSPNMKRTNAFLANVPILYTLKTPENF